MVKYSYQGDRFLIEDYQNAKTFASFLPAVAGKDGKPLWAFYANVGQCMGGFGVTSKDTPITPFDSANLAYQNINIKSFRTFLKVNGNPVYPFFDKNKGLSTMSIGKSDFSISYREGDLEYQVDYITASHRDYAGLLRLVKIINHGNKAMKVEGADGLPIFFPNGLSNYCYKELVSLMAAYCLVEGSKEKTPFVKFKTSTGDNSIVKQAVSGNGFVTVDENDEKLSVLIDPYSVFGDRLDLLEPEKLLSEAFLEAINSKEQTENKLPCAFSLFQKEIPAGGSYSFVSLYGSFDNKEEYLRCVSLVSVKGALKMKLETEALVDSLLTGAKIKTSSPIFDRYLAQSYLDNGLRGGFPCLLNEGDNPQVYYLYGRKHGDMERDYNQFDIPSSYYSGGPGNFRDVNQNRRNDLFFSPFVGDYNVHLFFSLIQADGQNPLTVKPESFLCLDKAKALEGLSDKEAEIIKPLLDSYSPSSLYTALRDYCHLPKEKADAIFSNILSCSKQQIQACFSEGYWVDHWTYNVDLLEDYSSIYPDKEEEFLFKRDYPYFYSPVYVEPRSEKYCLLPDGKIRQYGAIDLAKLKDESERRGLDLKKTYWLSDKTGKRVEVNLAEKIVNLILVKFSTLDAEQMGIEMECEKPGWNDAMNGLPGLFSSGMSETVELLRLVDYAVEHLSNYPNRTLTLLSEQGELYRSLLAGLSQLNEGLISPFAYWDMATSAREKLRLKLKEKADGSVYSLRISELLKFLADVQALLIKGIKKAKKIGGGILPSYIVHDADRYERTGHVNHLGYQTVKILSFKVRLIPYFLEASARAMKLGPKAMGEEDYKAIKASGLYDKKLHFYKTCDDIEDAPFEIGRVHAFTKGWLERECNFLHMSYKYMLGLLKDGLYEDFYKEIKTNFVCFMDPYVYGRDPAEASSFVVPSCNPEEKNWGRGFFARLTGANAELLNMFVIAFAGEHIFSNENELLHFHLDPKLPSQAFDEKDEVSYCLFSKCQVTIHNPKRIDLYKGCRLIYEIEGKKYDDVNGKLAARIRAGQVEKIYVEASPK